MLSYANIPELEARLNELEILRIHLKASFYKEVCVSLNRDIKGFEAQWSPVFGLTENASTMLGMVVQLQRVLATQGIHAFMDAYDELGYEDQCQINSRDWYNLGNQILRLNLQISKTKQQLRAARQNCQMKQALKDAGF